MGSLVEWPEKPYFNTLSLQPDEEIKINALIPLEAARGNILLKCGEELDGDIALFISFDVQYKSATITSKSEHGWAEIRKCYGIPIKSEAFIKVQIYSTSSHYKIYISSKHACDYPQIISCTRVTHLAICGDFRIESIKYVARPSPGLFSTKSKLISQPSKPYYGTIVIPIEAEEPEKLLMYPTMTPFVPVIPTIPTQAIRKVPVTETKIIEPYGAVKNFFVGICFFICIFFMLAVYLTNFGDLLIGKLEKEMD